MYNARDEKQQRQIKLLSTINGKQLAQKKNYFESFKELLLFVPRPHFRVKTGGMNSI